MSPRSTLFLKYFAYCAALVSGAVLLSGGVGLYFSYQENKAAIGVLQKEKARGAAANLQFVQEVERQLAWTLLPGATRAAPAELRLDYLKLLRLVPAITDLRHLDGAGREQLRVSRLGMDAVGGGEDFSRDPVFTGPKPGRPYLSPVYFRKETEPYMTVAVAGSGGQVTAADVNLKFMWDVVSRIRVGETGYAYVVDSAGHLVAHPDISLVLRKTDLSALPQVSAALAGDGAEALSISSRGLDGAPVLASFAAIAPLGWFVIVEQPQSEAFAPLRASVARTGLLLLAGVVLSILAAAWLARRMVTPVFADLERKVEARTAELTEALDQQTAIAETMRTIAQSPGDAKPVFAAIAANCLHLFNGRNIAVLLVQDGKLQRPAYVTRGSQGVDGAEKHYPLPLERRHLGARAVLDAALVHVPDIDLDGSISEQSRGIAAAVGYRAIMIQPMFRGGDAIGAIAVNRAEPGPFSAKEIALLRTFADQAAIAIENVRLFEEIREKSRQLEVANRHKSEFLAGMSHELRTPLNAIIGFSEVLHEKMFGELNAKQAEYIADIHASGRHLLSLINGILDLSKIEAGRMDLELARFDLPAVIDDALTLVRERAARGGIALERDVDARLGEFVGDQLKFKQIVLNLLSNALKFTPAGGRVGVKATLINGVAQVSVSDSGIGIDPAEHQAIFEAFRQAGGGDLARKREGTGLGLTLTRRFVELHGGRIWVDSAPAKGATFSFTLPVRAWPNH